MPPAGRGIGNFVLISAQKTAAGRGPAHQKACTGVFGYGTVFDSHPDGCICMCECIRPVARTSDGSNDEQKGARAREAGIEPPAAWRARTAGRSRPRAADTTG